MILVLILLDLASEPNFVACTYCDSISRYDTMKLLFDVCFYIFPLDIEIVKKADKGISKLCSLDKRIYFCVTNGNQLVVTQNRTHSIINNKLCTVSMTTMTQITSDMCWVHLCNCRVEDSCKNHYNDLIISARCTSFSSSVYGLPRNTHVEYIQSAAVLRVKISYQTAVKGVSHSN